MSRDRRRGGRDAPREQTGSLVVVGRRPVLEAVRSGRALEVMVAEGSRSTPALRELVEAAGASNVPVVSVPRERVESLADGTLHQGVAASVAPVPRMSEGDLSSMEWSPEAMIVVLDGVTDPHNLGAIARTAEAAGAEALVIPKRGAAPLGNVALKSSAGALLHLPIAEVPNLTRAIGRLQEAGFWTVGLDAFATKTVFEPPPSGKVALVLGAEGQGLSRLVSETCDELLSIPLRGRVASLNVSVAAGVALFAYAARGKEKEAGRQE